jgi:hypothetical protein
MAYCPTCATEVQADAVVCSQCAALFRDGFRPLARQPGRGARAFVLVSKVVLALISGGFLMLGATAASAEKGHPAWTFACVLVGVGVIAAALLARLRWSVLMLFAAVPLGFVSCAANFAWRGG